jgi:flavin-dependent dehydrogenase
VRESGGGRARIVIAADGRRSPLLFGLGLARHPAAPRRYALGTYYEQVGELGTDGEMHVRAGHYVGVAAVPGGLANVCVVMPARRLRRWLPAGVSRVVDETVRRDPMLAARFAQARRVAPVTVLGPMAVDAAAPGIDGLLAAGDAAGFVDPITGDGLRLAMRGGELAAAAALAALDGHGDPARLLQDLRARELGPKLRVNRALRALVAAPGAIRGASLAAHAVPGLFAWLIRYAGDVPLAGRGL